MSVKLARMADAVDVAALPPGLPAYAGYVDGYSTFHALCKRFYPYAHCLSITVEGGPAEIADLENGTFGGGTQPEIVAAGVRWLQRRLAERVWRPGLYFPVSWQTAVEAELDRELPHEPRSSYRLWGAHWVDFEPDTIPAGLDAVQWEGGVDAAYDLSVVAADFFPGPPLH